MSAPEVVRESGSGETFSLGFSYLGISATLVLGVAVGFLG